MSNRKFVRTVLAAALGAVALTATGGAYARGDDHERGHGWGHYRYHRHHHTEVVHERVVVREVPVVYERPIYYPGNPAIVIGFDIPSLMIPLR